MRIKNIYPSYIQKSRLFLYPILGIRRGSSVTPVQTYLTWDNVYTLNDNRFIVVYHLRDDKEFKTFEDKLTNHKLFEGFFELEDGNGAYVFDFSGLKKEYKKIINGKYSTLIDEYKSKVLLFFKNHSKHHMYIESYLYPDKYFRNYARILDVEKTLLEQVGELCSLPDLSQEELGIKTKVLNFESINNL
tara:strand:- start:111 stop:677 length:567 start_codon:yes stop_codon:yes gene_type:complete